MILQRRELRFVLGENEEALTLVRLCPFQRESSADRLPLLAEKSHGYPWGGVVSIYGLTSTKCSFNFKNFGSNFGSLDFGTASGVLETVFAGGSFTVGGFPVKRGVAGAATSWTTVISGLEAFEGRDEDGSACKNNGFQTSKEAGKTEFLEKRSIQREKAARDKYKLIKINKARIC